LRKKGAIRDTLQIKGCERTEEPQACSVDSKEEYQDLEVLRIEASDTALSFMQINSFILNYQISQTVYCSANKPY